MGDNAYVLALAALVPLGGRLGDRFGRRTLFGVYSSRGLRGAFVAAGAVLGLVSIVVFAALPGRRDRVADVHPVAG